MKIKSRLNLQITFDARMIAHSGIGTHVKSLLEEFIKLKHPDLTLIGDTERIRTLLPEFEGSILHWNAPIYSLKELLRFPETGGGCLHFPHYNASPFHLKQSLVVVHDLIHLQSKEFAKPHFRLYAKTLLGAVARNATRIVTVSDYTRTEFLNRYPHAESKTTTIHNGLDHARFQKPDPSALKPFRLRYGLPPRYLLCVGIGKRHKNVDFVIKSLAPLWKSGKLKQPLVLGGAGGNVPDYVASQIASDDVAPFVRTVPFLAEEELPLLYGGADLFLMPSLLEGFGLPLLEAMACGCPVFSSSAASLPEIGRDGALYFDPENGEMFREGVRLLLKNGELRNELVRNGEHRARQFQWKKSAEAFLDLYGRMKCV